MSLPRTIDRLARAIKREAARNPDFAGRLEAILAAHVSRRPLPVDLDVADALGPEEAEAESATAPDINPVAIAGGQGGEALAALLADQSVQALRALATEHNLDPAGELADADQEATVAHIVAAALRRVERDRKLFDY
jgi:hypothetical protein